MNINIAAVGSMEPKTVNARLRALRLQTKPRVTLLQAAEALGLKKASSYEHYEKAHLFKQDKLPLHKARALAELFSQNGVARERVFALAGVETADLIPHDAEIVRAPMIGWSQIENAAIPVHSSDLADFERMVIVHYKRETVFALLISGDSMDRIAPPGSTIIVDYEDRIPTDRKYYIARVNGQTVFRQYREEPQRFEPYSLNTEHSAIYPAGIVEIVGRVVQVSNAL